MALNLTSHLAHGPHGLESDPLRNFKFLVNIQHATRAAATTGAKGHKRSVSPKNIGFTLGFTSVEGFTVTTESIPYRQGGYNTTSQQIPGQSAFSPVTFSTGVLLGNRQKWDWMRELFSVQVGGGTGRTAGEARTFRAPKVDIYLLEHPVTNGTAAKSPWK